MSECDYHDSSFLAADDFSSSRSLTEPGDRGSPARKHRSPPGVTDNLHPALVLIENRLGPALVAAGGSDVSCGRQLSEASVTTKACVTCTWAWGEHLRWPDEDRELLRHVESASPPG
jgi:hypothetical protein